MRPSAAIAETAVISPRGHDSACPRQMIQARISGASAPASRNQRAIVWTSQPVSVAGPFVSPIVLLASILYQVRNRPTPNKRPPMRATISDRDSPESLIGRTLQRSGGLRVFSGDGHRHGGARVAATASGGLARGRRRPAEAPEPRVLGGHRRLEDAARLFG